MEILSLKKKMKKPAGKLERAKYIFFFILVSDLWALAKMNKLVYYVNIPKRIVTLLYPSINMVFTFLLFSETKYSTLIIQGGKIHLSQSLWRVQSIIIWLKGRVTWQRGKSSTWQETARASLSQRIKSKPVSLPCIVIRLPLPRVGIAFTPSPCPLVQDEHVYTVRTWSFCWVTSLNV